MNNAFARIMKAVAPVLFLAFGVIMAVFSRNDLKKMETYPQMKAVIDDIIDERGADDSMEHHVIVRYTVGGKEYSTELNEYKNSFRIGDEVTISYNPDDPKDIVSYSPTTSKIIFAAGIAVAVIACGVIAVKAIAYIKHR